MGRPTRASERPRCPSRRTTWMPGSEHDGVARGAIGGRRDHEAEVAADREVLRSPACRSTSRPGRCRTCFRLSWRQGVVLEAQHQLGVPGTRVIDGLGAGHARGVARPPRCPAPRPSPRPPFRDAPRSLPGGVPYPRRVLGPCGARRAARATAASVHNVAFLRGFSCRLSSGVEGPDCDPWAPSIHDMPFR